MTIDRFLEIYPLFGWFYLSVAVYALWAVLVVIFSPRLNTLNRWISRALVVFVLALSLPIAVTTFSREIDRIELSLGHLFSPFPEKIEYEHQYYSTYFLGLRPTLHELEDPGVVRLIDRSILEFLIARSYLYPVGLQESGLHTVEAGDIVIADSGLVKAQKWIVLKRAHDVSLAIALPDPALYLEGAELEVWEATPSAEQVYIRELDR